MTETWTNPDPKTRQTIPSTERTITIFYEFEPGAKTARWRRSMIIESAGGNYGMFEEGNVKSLTDSSMDLTIAKSTCDDVGIHIDDTPPNPLYYQRTGNSLQLSDQPIQTYNNIADAIVNMAIVQPMQEAITQVLREAFTFGSARTILTANSGSFNLDSSSSIKQFASKKVKLGCFSSIGAGFSSSKIQADW